MLGFMFTSAELRFNEMMRILWIVLTLPLGILFMLKGALVFYLGWREEKKSGLKILNDT